MRHFRQRQEQQQRQQHQQPCGRGRAAVNYSLPTLQQLAQLAVVGVCVGTGGWCACACARACDVLQTILVVYVIVPLAAQVHVRVGRCRR